MTKLDGAVKKYHESTLDSLERHDCLAVPESDCEEQQNLQNDTQNWLSDRINTLVIEKDDTLEDLLEKIMRVYDEAEKRKFVLTNILERLKAGDSLTDTLRKYREAGLGDVQSGTDPDTGLPDRSLPAGPSVPDNARRGSDAGAQGGRRRPRKRSFFGRILTGARWAQERAIEFIFLLLDNLKSIIGKLILMVGNVLQGFAKEHSGLGLEMAVDTGATGPTIGFSVNITKELDLKVLNDIVGRICSSTQR